MKEYDNYHDDIEEIEEQKEEEDKKIDRIKMEYDKEWLQRRSNELNILIQEYNEVASRLNEDVIMAFKMTTEEYLDAVEEMKNGNEDVSENNS